MSSVRVGVDLGGTKIEAIALDPAGEVCWRQRVPTPQGDYPATLGAVAALVRAAEAAAGRPAVVGVGTPGAPSLRTGRIKNANSTCLNGQPLEADLAALLRRPLRLANDADCFALSEAVDGAGAGARSLFGVIVGTGTGGGVVVNGRLVDGPNRIAGEWGHNPLPWPSAAELPGPRCYCGRRGCIETWLSGPGMARDHAAHGGHGDAAAISAAAQAGDALAAATLQRHAGRMARALASVINILDPEVIVLGGGVSQVGALYRLVPELWGEYVFSDSVLTRLLPPRHGDASGVRGAAWLWSAAEAALPPGQC